MNRWTKKFLLSCIGVLALGLGNMGWAQQVVTVRLMGAHPTTPLVNSISALNSTTYLPRGGAADSNDSIFVAACVANTARTACRNTGTFATDTIAGVAVGTISIAEGALSGALNDSTHMMIVVSRRVTHAGDDVGGAIASQRPGVVVPGSNFFTRCAAGNCASTRNVDIPIGNFLAAFGVRPEAPVDDEAAPANEAAALALTNTAPYALVLAAVKDLVTNDQIRGRNQLVNLYDGNRLAVSDTLRLVRRLDTNILRQNIPLYHGIRRAVGMTAQTAAPSATDLVAVANRVSFVNWSPSVMVGGGQDSLVSFTPPSTTSGLSGYGHINAPVRRQESTINGTLSSDIVISRSIWNQLSGTKGSSAVIAEGNKSFNIAVMRAGNTEVQIGWGDSEYGEVFEEKYDFALCLAATPTTCASGAPATAEAIPGAGPDGSRYAAAVDAGRTHHVLFREKSTSGWTTTTTSQISGFTVGPHLENWDGGNSFTANFDVKTIDVDVTAFARSVLDLVKRPCAGQDVEEEICEDGAETNPLINGIRYTFAYRTQPGTGTSSLASLWTRNIREEGGETFAFVTFGDRAQDRRFAVISVDGLPGTSVGGWTLVADDVTSSNLVASSKQGMAITQDRGTITLSMGGPEETAFDLTAHSGVFVFPTHAGMNALIARVAEQLLATKGDPRAMHAAARPATGIALNDTVPLFGTDTANVSAAYALGALLKVLITAENSNSGVLDSVMAWGISDGSDYKHTYFEGTFRECEAGGDASSVLNDELVFMTDEVACLAARVLNRVSGGTPAVTGDGFARRVSWDVNPRGSDWLRIVNAPSGSGVVTDFTHDTLRITQPPSTASVASTLFSLRARSRIEMFGLPTEGADIDAWIPVRVVPLKGIEHRVPQVVAVASGTGVKAAIDAAMSANFREVGETDWDAPLSGAAVVLRQDTIPNPFGGGYTISNVALDEEDYAELEFSLDTPNPSFMWRWVLADDANRANYDDTSLVEGVIGFRVFSADSTYALEIERQPVGGEVLLGLTAKQTADVDSIRVRLRRVGPPESFERGVRVDWYVVQGNCTPTLENYTDPTCAMVVTDNIAGAPDQSFTARTALLEDVPAGSHRIFAAVSTRLLDPESSVEDHPAPAVPVLLSDVVTMTVVRQAFVNVSGVTITGSTFPLNGFFELKETVAPANATNKEVTWTLVTEGTTAPGADLTYFDGVPFLTATGRGDIIVRATIADGIGDGTEDFVTTVKVTVGAAGSIAEEGGEVPVVDAPAEVVVVAPVAPRAALTAGPNPASRGEGRMNFFYEGPALASGTLRIFDASGNLVRTINVANGEIPAWDLSDNRGRAAADGTYLVRGALVTVQGARIAVSTLVGITR